jgi:hypothetical protein
MPFPPRWTEDADSKYREFQAAATASLLKRQQNRKAKAAKAEGLFKQLEKCVQLLLDNPRHPGLNTHEYDSIEHPYDKKIQSLRGLCTTPNAQRLPSLLVLRTKQKRNYHHRHNTASVR